MKQIMKQILLMPLGLMVLLYCACVAADPHPCTAIVDDAARLGCFDSAFPAAEDVDQDSESLEILDSAALTRMEPLESRRTQELALAEQRFALTPHKPNYVLPFTYNGNADYSEFGAFGNLFSDSEAKLQLSLKSRIAPNLWGRSSLWVAYTQQSYWQVYADRDASAPFRETNHEPEIFWEFPINFDVLGWNARVARVALNHQSNGRSEPLSRSWNRLTGQVLLQKGALTASVKSWYRLKEDNDDNPNIEDFMGRVQLGLAFRHKKQTFSINVKNNLSSDNRSGIELNWSFPLIQKLEGYLQLYSGYGENLIDMENRHNRIGFGIALTEWL